MKLFEKGQIIGAATVVSDDGLKVALRCACEKAHIVLTRSTVQKAARESDAVIRCVACRKSGRPPARPRYVKRAHYVGRLTGGDWR